MNTVRRSPPTLSAAAVASVVIAAVLAVLMVVAPAKVPAGTVVQGAILGAGSGLMAIGLVLVFRSTRTVNFALGAMGGFPASIAVAAFLGKGLPWPVAVLVAVAVGALVGALIERFVIRAFVGASPLTLTVATIGLAQVLGGLELLVPRVFGSPAVVGSFPTPLNDLKFEISPVVITGNDLLLLLAVPVVLGGISWFLLRTDAGIAVRGAAENRERAQLLGIPVARLSTIVWCLVGGIAALTITLRAPGEGLALDAAAGPLLLLPALAAAVVAGMERLPVAFLAGVGLGVLDQLVRWNVDKQSITSVVFLVVILVALAVQRRSTGRSPGDDVWAALPRPALPRSVRQLPEVVWTKRAGALVLAAAAVLIPAVASAGQLSFISSSVVFAIVVLSVVLLSGWSGSISLGQFAIAGIGGIVTANLVSHTRLDLLYVLALAALAGAAVAVLIGAPALRLNGLYLAVTTIAFAVALDQFLLNPVNFRQLIPSSFDLPLLWGRIDLGNERALTYLCLALLAIFSAMTWSARVGRPGRVLIGVRDNERAAATAGLDTRRVRLSAFLASGMLAGVAGGLYAMILGGIGVHSFEPANSLLVFSMAVIGGIDSIGGGLLGVLLVQGASYLFPDFRLIITGTGLLIILRVSPRGVGDLLHRATTALQLRVARRRGITVSVSEEAPPVGPEPSAGPDPLAVPQVAAVGPDVGDAIVTCRSVTASYGPLRVLFGVDFDVRRGEMLALLGTNGAGKSTILRCLTGLLPVDGGHVAIDGRNVGGRSPEAIAREGIALMPGGRGLFSGLTVHENLRLAGWMRRGSGRSRDVTEQVVAESVALFPVIQHRLDLRAGELSGGEQQMVSLAMALATRPQVLCIDELSLGLAPTTVSALTDHVRRIHQAGTTVVLVEQSVNIALLLADRAVFLEKGVTRFDGPTRSLLDRPDVLRAVFVGGGDVQPGTPASRAQRDVVPDLDEAPVGLTGLLECRDLVKRFGGVTAVDHVSLRIAPGSVTGIIGHNGAGKTTLFDLLTGFTHSDGGRVLIAGVDVTDEPPHRRAIAGLGRSFQEARLFPALTVAETIGLALDRHLANRDPVAAALRLPAALDSEEQAGRRVDELLATLGLTSFRDRLTSELSTGMRRIVELGCILAERPAVVLLDEPSAGVAQREAEALGPLLRSVQRQTGCSLVVIEHDMHLLAGLCDELIAFELGAVIATGPPGDVLAHERVIESYLGTDQDVIARSGDRERSDARA